MRSAASGFDTPYHRLLESELEHIGRMQDYYLHQPADSGHLAEDGVAQKFLAGEMLIGIAANVIDWRLTLVPFTTSVGARPAGSPLARRALLVATR